MSNVIIGCIFMDTMNTTLECPIYYIKLKSRLSVCLSALFVWSGSQRWLHGSMSDLPDVIALSSGMMKFIFESF